MSVTRTAEEAFAVYVLLRVGSPQGWVGPDTGRRQTTQQGSTHWLARLANETEQAGLDPVDDEGTRGERPRSDGKVPGPAERHKLPPMPPTVLHRATPERAGRS